MWSKHKKQAEPGPRQESQDPKTDPAKAIKDFQDRIAAQEDTLYGVALLHECLALLYADQEETVESYRRMFRNIIHTGKTAAFNAAELLEKAQKDPSVAAQLPRINLSPFSEHPQAAELSQRTAALVDAYRQLFPTRPRSQDLSKEEVLQLIENASKTV